MPEMFRNNGNKDLVVPVSSQAMYQWMVNKRQRSVEDARRMAGDMRAWLVIGAIFIGTLLVVWMPIIFNALHHA